MRDNGFALLIGNCLWSARETGFERARADEMRRVSESAHFPRFEPFDERLAHLTFWTDISHMTYAPRLPLTIQSNEHSYYHV